MLFKKVFKEKILSIETFYWAISFTLVALGFILCLVAEIFGVYLLQLAFAVHINDTFIIWFQLAVSIKVFSVFKGMENKTLTKYRVFLYYFLVAIIVFIPLHISPSMEISQNGIYGIQIVGIKKLDLYFEGIHSVMAVASFFFIPGYKNLIFIKIAFLLLFISEALQFINILLFAYSNNTLYILEWALAMVMLILFLIGVFRNYFLREKISNRKPNLSRKIFDEKNNK